MTKVLQIVGTMNRGGAEVMLMDILRHKPHDLHFDFLVNQRGEEVGAFDDEILSHGAAIYHIGTQGTLGPKRYMAELKKVIGAVKPDVVHIHLNAKSGFIAYACKKCGVKRIIAHCHADIKFRGPLVSKMLHETEMFCQKWLIDSCATDFWGCSIPANNRLFWPWRQKQTKVINNAIDTEKYRAVDEQAVHVLRESYNLPHDCIVMGNVGRIVRHKGIAFIPEVMVELKKHGVDSAFVVVGRPDELDYIDEMMAKAKLYGVDYRILMLGERADIPLVMNTFDVFVGPALREGFGMVAVEAQAAGVPCVLYEGFPKLVDMNLGIVRFHSNFNVGEWANDVIALSNSKIHDRELVSSTIKDLGFDSVENARSVCNMYSSTSVKIQINV